MFGVATLLPCFALGSDAANDLRHLIDQTPELSAVFGEMPVQGLSPHRAEATTHVGSKRHAVVLFSDSEAANGQIYCHAALGRPERTAWVDKLIAATHGDIALADALNAEQAVRIRFQHAEYSALKLGTGWSAAVCSVPEDKVWVQNPLIPNADQINKATYLLGKNLYDSGKTDEALNRFKSLKTDPQRYADAVLFVIAILQRSHPDIAEQLQAHVDVQKANDLDALGAYVDALQKVGANLKELDLAEARCRALAGNCKAHTPSN